MHSQSSVNQIRVAGSTPDFASPLFFAPLILTLRILQVLLGFQHGSGSISKSSKITSTLSQISSISSHQQKTQMQPSETCPGTARGPGAPDSREQAVNSTGSSAHSNSTDAVPGNHAGGSGQARTGGVPYRWASDCRTVCSTSSSRRQVYIWQGTAQNWVSSGVCVVRRPTQ